MTTVQVLTFLGLPSIIIGGIVGHFIWRLQKRIEEDAAERRAHEKNLREYERFQISMTTAISCVCEANAIALQNGKCNGETHKALDYLEAVKKEQRDFLIKQGIEHLF